MASEYDPKGRALEKAVRFIQEEMLKTDPALKGAKFEIGSNQIIIKSGIRMEFDVLVKTLPGSIHESVSVFECKNWSKPVGLDQIMIFTRKLDAVAANRGFFVAKKFTKSAESAALLDQRIKLIRCSDELIGPLRNLGMVLIQHFHEFQWMQVYFGWQSVRHDVFPDGIDLETTSCSYMGRPFDLKTFLETEADLEILRERRNRRYNHRGVHWREGEISLTFDSNMFFLGDVPVKFLRCRFGYTITVQRSCVCSRFDLEGHGRFVAFEPIENFLPNRIVKANIIQVGNSGATLEIDIQERDAGT